MKVHGKEMRVRVCGEEMRVCGKEVRICGKDMRECGKEMIILYVWEYVGKSEKHVGKRREYTLSSSYHEGLCSAGAGSGPTGSSLNPTSTSPRSTQPPGLTCSILLTQGQICSIFLTPD